jgi:hypothetical protein
MIFTHTKSETMVHLSAVSHGMVISYLEIESSLVQVSDVNPMDKRGSVYACDLARRSILIGSF